MSLIGEHDSPLGEWIGARITGSESVGEEGGYTSYAILVTNKSDGTSWSVYRRFSNFLRLQSQLPPGLVPRDVALHRGVLASSTAPEVVKRRRESLEFFLSFLLQQPVVGIKQVSDFFRLATVDSTETSNNTSIVSSDGEHDLKDLTSKVNKLSEERLNRFLLSLMGKVGETSDAGFPTVNSIYSLIELEHLVCVETNLDSACIVNAIVNIPGWNSMLGLCNFIRNPTIAESRLRAFKIARSLSTVAASITTVLQDDDVAIAQYTAWSSRKSVSEPETNPLHAVFGPQSPLARSVYVSAASPGGGGGHAVATAAMEAREWVSFTVCTADSDFNIAGVVRESDWIQVKSPSESVKKIVGQVGIKYRIQGSGSGSLYEVRLEWRLPHSVDMERVINLLWDGDFGFLSRTAPSSNPVAGEAANMVETGEYALRDHRRVGGSVLVNLVKSCMRTFNGRVVLAAASDPSPPIAPAGGDRRIRHLHYIGCEVDVEKATITGCALLSSESIFLIAGDLLGERLALWQAIEVFSSKLLVVPSSDEGTSKMSEWLHRFFPQNSESF